jgi:protein TonB
MTVPTIQFELAAARHGHWASLALGPACAFVALLAAMSLAACGNSAREAEPAIANLPPPAPWAPVALESLDPAQLRERADLALREQRLYAPAGNNALEYFLALREREGASPELDRTISEFGPYVQTALGQARTAGNDREAARLQALLDRTRLTP